MLDCRDPGRLADFIAQNINLRHGDRQRILEELHPIQAPAAAERASWPTRWRSSRWRLSWSKRYATRVAQVQRDMILREQMKVLQHELGDDGDEEIEEYTAENRDAEAAGGDPAAS